ncbi:hypothetical protein Y032_0013g1948 [Ancylostoma ceylanicum]|uniref:Uncharacterized protein n=1 Tax=Ancylostoma ceylanicum TaxID=53326 RepID=A0A016VAU6_9BILA|nr:hypothetical protein Y032_0013g1948 [Ancylostoma ceylanicum]
MEDNGGLQIPSLDSAMVDGEAPLSAAERRERRMKRILGDGENRIKKILSGPSGDEQRLPPMLEGGEYKSSVLANSEDSAQTSSTASVGTTEIQLNKGPRPNSFTYSVLSNMQKIGIPLSFLFGVCMRVMMMYGVTFNVLLPWLLLFLGPRVPTMIHDVPKFITDVATLLRSGNYCGVENVLKRSYAAVSFVQLFITHILVMVGGYLFAHTGLIIFHKATFDG